MNSVTDQIMDSDDNDLKEMNSEVLSEQMTSVVSTLEKQDTDPVSDECFMDNVRAVVDVIKKNNGNEQPMDESNVEETSVEMTMENKEEELNQTDLIDETDHEKFSNVQIKVIDVPDDDDLFDFLHKDKDNKFGDELSDVGSDEENTKEIRKGELYRYLTTNPSYTPSQSNEVTPYHSGDESDTSGQSDSIVYLSTDVESDQDESVTLDHSTSRCETPVQEDQLQEVQAKPARKQKLSKAFVKTESTSSGQMSEKTREKLEKCKVATNKWLKDLELPKNLSLDKPLEFKINDLNQYLTCGLCKGYLYEASTITECMHTFCKNCIVRHCMEVSLHCPVCNILIHPTDPFVHIRLDRMIQDIVYKILPKVAETEFQHIKDFYAAHPEILEPQEIPEPPVEPEESPPKPDVSLPQSQLVSVLLESECNSEDDDCELDKKFVRVVSRATIENVCTFLKTKLSLHDDKQVSIYCCGAALEDQSFTLENVQAKYFAEEDPLVLLQYRITDDTIS